MDKKPLVSVDNDKEHAKKLANVKPTPSSIEYARKVWSQST